MCGVGDGTVDILVGRSLRHSVMIIGVVGTSGRLASCGCNEDILIQLYRPLLGGWVDRICLSRFLQSLWSPIVV